jgi:hypothetical protein
VLHQRVDGLEHQVVLVALNEIRAAKRYMTPWFTGLANPHGCVAAMAIVIDGGISLSSNVAEQLLSNLILARPPTRARNKLLVHTTQPEVNFHCSKALELMKDTSIHSNSEIVVSGPCA